MCQDQPTIPLLPTLFAEPPKERGELPVEYRTLAEHEAPRLVLAYSVGWAQYATGLGLT